MAGMRLRCGALLLLVAMLAGRPAVAEGLKIGAVMPLSGPSAATGAAALNAIRLAVDEINKAGGVLGGKLDLVVGDDHGTAQAGLDAARKLVRGAKVNVLIGPMSGPVFLPVAKGVAIPAGLPILTGSATSPALDGLDTQGLVFRTVPSATGQAGALADVAHDKEYDSVAIIHASGDDELAQEFSKTFTRAGGKVTAMVAYRPGETDFGHDIEKAATDGPQALLVIADARSGAVILKQALDGGFFNKFVLSDGLKSPSVIEAIGGQFLDGAAGATPVPLADDPAARTFAAAYKARYGEPSAQAHAGNFYDAVYLVALAAQKAQSAEGSRLRDALRQLSAHHGDRVGPGEFAKAKDLLAKGEAIRYVGASGPLTFDAHGDIAGNFAQWEMTDGKIENVREFEPKPR